MNCDYRNTAYCLDFNDISSKKKLLENEIRRTGNNAKLSRVISDNGSKYKQRFMEIYNRKCGYCGVSDKIIPLRDFEIDHFIPKSRNGEGDTEAIDNLILSCAFCNRRKKEFYVEANERSSLHPDTEGIKNTFVRDEMYNICISRDGQANENIVRFYNKLKLNAEVHRIDYLLMSINGLIKRLENNPVRISEKVKTQILFLLYRAYKQLLEKRNSKF